MAKVLPVAPEEFFELRFHSIGGQGAYTTGQMIASVGAKIDSLKSAIFASYGSEKKGAPVNVFIRFLESEKEITNYSAVTNPNIVVVFHEQLLKTIDVLHGIKTGGKLIVNTELSAQELADTYNLNIDEIITVDGTKIAIETGAKINTVMYGAVMKVLDFFDYEEAKNQISVKLSYKYPQLVAANVTAFEQGYEHTITANVTTSNNETKVTTDILGFNNQIEGGIILGANALKVDRSISREGYLPTFEKELCINCTKCDTTCPDDCFVWEEVEGRRGRMEMTLKGIDYHYCKGCLRCVEACPTQALKPAVEQRTYAQEHRVNKIFDFVSEV